MKFKQKKLKKISSAYPLQNTHNISLHFFVLFLDMYFCLRIQYFVIFVSICFECRFFFFDEILLRKFMIRSFRIRYVCPIFQIEIQHILLQVQSNSMCVNVDFSSKTPSSHNSLLPSLPTTHIYFVYVLCISIRTSFRTLC